MLTVHGVSEYWVLTWDALEKQECLWALQMSHDARADFEVSFESMIKASIPEMVMASLRDAWSALDLQKPFCRNAEVRWRDLYCDLGEPEQVTDKEVRGLLKTVWNSQEGATERPANFSPKITNATSRFLKELNHIALCTLYRFCCSSFRFIAGLPGDVVEELYSELFRLTRHLVFQELI